ncbi:hypothetical protein HO173_006785 [Letharia columbiana]|uniref:Uncharacterized protein n=1 Tax=Letharia columbiana TaxID=112416 RepID=A0A8H6FUY7_9LECA|nr:uncharacterized protein HO173_006785 [Letharia columbiana]KAF6235156.1 hypothetical protein HO173_006785 [Letharia columbiana]
MSWQISSFILCCTHLPSDQQTCFQGFLDKNGGQSAASGSSNGTSEEALPPECSYISTQINDCVSSTSGFTTMANSEQASCICFNTDGSWNGTVWDNAATTCYQAISSAGSANASALSAYDSGVVGFCTKFVNAGILSSAGVSSSTGVSSSAGASSGSGVAVSTGQPSSTTGGGSGAVTGSSVSNPTPSSTQKSEVGHLKGQRSTVIAALAFIACIFDY